MKRRLFWHDSTSENNDIEHIIDGVFLENSLHVLEI